ncbi:hypothetical protein ACHAWF_012576, partial [Thalassiosira exigua]
MRILRVASVGAVVVASGGVARAFAPPPSSPSAFALTLARGRPSSRRTSRRRRPPTSLPYREGDAFDAPPATPPTVRDSTGVTPPSDFRNRMKRLVAKERRRTSRPSNVRTVATLEEFAEVVEEGRREDAVVVVRFHASWCNLCRALRPSYDKAATRHPRAVFLDVPILAGNANLHQ